MTFIEVGSFIIDVEKITYVHVLTSLSVDVYFAGDVKLRISGQDTQDFLNYLRGIEQ